MTGEERNGGFKESTGLHKGYGNPQKTIVRNLDRVPDKEEQLSEIAQNIYKFPEMWNNKETIAGKLLYEGMDLV